MRSCDRRSRRWRSPRVLWPAAALPGLTSPDAPKLRGDHTRGHNHPPREDYDAFAIDAALREGVAREAPLGPAEGGRYGPVVGSAETHDRRELANKYPPELRSHDRYGHRIDEVDYPPGLSRADEAGDGARACTRCLGASAGRVATWPMPRCSTCTPGRAGHRLSAHDDPRSVPALRVQPELAADWEPRLTRTHLRPALHRRRPRRRAPPSAWP